MAENIKIQIVVSPTVYRLLKKWASFGGKTASEFAGQIIINRVESNVDVINRLDEETLKDNPTDEN